MLGLLILQVLAWVPSATAQGGRVRHLEIGVTMQAPKGYGALPIPRSEPLLKLSFVRRDEESGQPFGFSLFRLDRAKMSVGPPQQFLAQVLRGKPVGSVKELSSLGTYRRMSLSFERRERRGMLFGYLGQEYVYYLVGEAPGELYDEELRLWRRLAGELRIHPPTRDDRKRSALERHYSHTRYTDKPRRIAARLTLVDGWSAYDGEESIYLIHGLSSQAWKNFETQLKGVRRYMVDNLLQHRNEEPHDVAVIRLCKDRTEYLDFGGRPDAAGYFSTFEDELVLYDPGDPARLTAVLRHESFHQFIYSAVGGIAPHIWFDEGYAEFLASAEVGGSRVVGFHALPHHQETLVQMLAQGGPGLMPLDTFLHLSQEEFYSAPAERYAQAWVWVDFLLRSDYGQRSWRGKEFLANYVKYLREDWLSRVKKVSSGAPMHLGTLVEIREQAMQRAMQKLDMKDTEAAFHRYVQRIVSFRK